MPAYARSASSFADSAQVAAQAMPFMVARRTHAHAGAAAKIGDGRSRDIEAVAAVVRPSRMLTAAEVRAYLESLPDLWAKTSDAGRQAIAEDVLRILVVTLTAHATARGWDAAFAAGVVRVKDGQSGRGERSHLDDRP